MNIQLDLGMLYVTGSVLVTTAFVYLLHAVGSVIGRSMFPSGERG
jgi:hypothetical protein